MATPKSLGYYMPAEWSRHTRTWMMWPYCKHNWRRLPDGSIPAQKAFVDIVGAIALFEEVTVGVSTEQWEVAQAALGGISNVVIFQVESDDIWVRDSGPTFLLKRDGSEVVGVDWVFNCWGEMGIIDGVKYFSWDRDMLVAGHILSRADKRRFTAPLVMEGGSFHVDGEGTVLVTEECLLNPNRNPTLTKADIEQHLIDYLGVDKVVWLPLGLYGDEDTNGHVDNFCCFVEPGHVLLAWTDNEADPQHAISTQALQILQATTDARGRTLRVTKLPIPSPHLEYRGDEVSGVQPEGFRVAGVRLAASYVNFYIANGGVVVPGFGDAVADAEAVRVLSAVFPDRRVVQVSTREILLGGGNIHCITQQQIE